MLEKSHQAELSQEIKERSEMLKFNLRILVGTVASLVLKTPNHHHQKPEQGVKMNGELSCNSLSS